MKQIVATMIAVVLATVGTVSAGIAPEDERDERVQKAYQALREAVDLVEYTHAPEANVFVADASNVWFGDRRPRIGVIVATSGFGDEPVGAVIDAVTPGGPADEAGLRVGDVITHVDGRRLGEGDSDAKAKAAAARELAEWSRTLEDGQAVTIDYIRDGEAASITVVARELSSAPSIEVWNRTVDQMQRSFDLRPDAYAPMHWVFPSAWLDMELVELNPELGEYFMSDHGVLVVRAPEDDSLGLEAGDVVLAVGGREVRDPSHALRILRSYEPDEELVLDIVRHGRAQTLSGTVPEANVELFGRPPRFFSEDD